MKILAIGGTGFIGPRVVRDLARMSGLTALFNALRHFTQPQSPPCASEPTRARVRSTMPVKMRRRQ